MATRKKRERSDLEKNELIIAEVPLSAVTELYNQVPATSGKYAQEQYRSVIPELFGAMNPGLGYSGNYEQNLAVAGSLLHKLMATHS